MTLKFYFLHRDSDQTAYGPPGDQRTVLLLDPAPLAAAWQPVTLELRGTDRPHDYQTNDIGVRLCSPALRDVLDAHRGPDDAIEWLPVSVRDPGGALHPYWALHPLSYPDVLDPERTMIGPDGDPMRPVVDLRRVTTERVFAVRRSGWLFVEDSVRKAIGKSRCTGVTFAKVAMTPP